MKKKIISILLLILFITMIIPIVESININAKKENILSKYQNIVQNNNTMLLNNYYESNRVLIDLNINGLSFGQELLWKANTTGINYEESAVVYSDGIAYIGSCSTHGGGHDKLFAIDTENGNIIWSTFIGPTYVGPVIDNDRIYIGASSHGYDPTNDFIFCINRSDGTIIWSRKIFWSSPESIQYDDDNIYFASYSIFALDKDDGSIVWEFPLDDFTATKPLLKDNAFFVATSGGKMFKVDIKDGKRIWEVSIPGKSWDNSITADGKGHIFLSIFTDKSINAYNEDTGELLWRYQLHDRTFSFNAYHNNVVYISDLDGYVYAINSSSGILIWEKKIGNTCDISSPTLSGGLLFIGTRDFNEGALFALNETNGDILWKFPIGGSVTSPPAIADGMMICGTDNWNTYAFDFGVGCGNWPLHRYDSYNTAFSPTGLIEWQFVSTSCNTVNNVTHCNIKNTYDHKVSDIELKLTNGVKADWYDNKGNLLNSESNYYMIDELSSQSSLTITISNYQINRPKKPKIQGPKYVSPGKEYTFMFTTDDPNNSEISYLIYWDDSTYAGWTPIQPSNQPLKLSHKWFQKENYNVKAKVKNPQGIESQWSDPFPIIMPYCYTSLFKNLNLLFNQFPKQHIKPCLLKNSSVELPLSKTWIKTFGGEKEQRGQSVQQTYDDGYIITGYTYLGDDSSLDVLLIKVDRNGNKIWDKTFGGSSADIGHAVQQTIDRGFIITGSSSWDKSLYLIKTDNNGNSLWEKNFNGLGEEEGKSVQQTIDGGYIITGYTNSFGAGNNDVWLIKVDNNGNKVWDKTFGGESFDYGTSLQLTDDGGYIITGYTNSFGAGNNDVWLIKTDQNGNKLWDRAFGGAEEDRGYFVQQTTDGGYIITGLIYLSNGPDVWLIKTDGNGNKVWDKTFGGISSEHGNCVQQTNDGGYIITGWTDSFGKDFANVWLIKTDSNGNKVWDKIYGGNSMECGDFVQQTNDGGYIVSGQTMEYRGGEILLLKTDNQGKLLNNSYDNHWFKYMVQTLNKYGMLF